MNNIAASKKIHSIEDARNLAKKRMPKLMFDFVDGAQVMRSSVKSIVLL